ncbi:MAG TPA: VOC family protein [Candidatus Binataceae bacterium]|nr:VOC family protein [Candidatus Binataceae bacterium]
MISHVSIGVRDLASAGKFYDAALAALGYKRLYDSSEVLGYGAENPELWVMKVERPVKADEASGLHLCFDATDHAAVDGFHKAGIKAGGHDNGKPGVRKDYGDNYYAAFLVDPEGYRLEAYCGR